MNNVVHFELPADDIARAKTFYSNVFGWELEDYPGMDYVIARSVPVDKDRMPTKSGAINGGMAKRSANLPAPSFAIDVDDIDAFAEKIIKAGGTMIMEKTPVGTMGFMAYFKDSEGNVLSIWETSGNG